MKKTILTLLMISICLVYSPNFYGLTEENHLSVKCAIMKFDAEYKNSKAVFVGEVINIEREGDKKIIEFKVKTFWKGIEDSKIKIIVYENTRFESPFDKGETHLVFAKDNEEGGLWDGRCSRSKDLNGSSADLEDDLKSLGKGKTCISLEN